MKRNPDISTSSGSLVLGATIASRLPSRFADFASLSPSPRMNVLVLATTAVGYFMAIDRWTSWIPLIHVLLGTAMTAAAASVLNQTIERHYDRLMPRTRNRPLPAGRIAPAEVLLLGILLSITGVLYLASPSTSSHHDLGICAAQLRLPLHPAEENHLAQHRHRRSERFRGHGIHRNLGALHEPFPFSYPLFPSSRFVSLPSPFSITHNDYAAGGSDAAVIDGDLSVTSRQILLYSRAVPVRCCPSP
jgi:hypothetical protein